MHITFFLLNFSKKVSTWTCHTSMFSLIVPVHYTTLLQMTQWLWHWAHSKYRTWQTEDALLLYTNSDSRKASRDVAAHFVSPCSTLRHLQGHVRISGWINLSPVSLTQQNTTVVPLVVTPANRERRWWRKQKSSIILTNVDRCVHHLKRLGVI